MQNDVIRLFQCNTTMQYDSTYSNTPRGAQGKQPLCANLQQTTLNAVDYKTYGTQQISLVSFAFSAETHRIANKIKHNEYE